MRGFNMKSATYGAYVIDASKNDEIDLMKVSSSLGEQHTWSYYF